MYMVMEHVDGLDLREILRSIPHDSPVSRWIPFHVHVLSETARALTYAYNKKDDSGQPLFIVHRDVSPSNILISREGLVKLTDFGVAKATRRTSVTMPGRLHGKVNYMAPEQVRGMECDHRSDVFSLGVVGYEMLAGRRPFDGDSDVAVLEKIRSMNLAPLVQAAPCLDPDLSAIVMKALSSNPDDRWQTAEDFSAALLGWAHDNGVNLTSANIADLLAGSFGAVATPDTGADSLDAVVDNELDRMMKMPGAGGDRTGTVSSPLMIQPPTGSPRKAGTRSPVRVWGAVSGVALLLVASTLLVSRIVSLPGTTTVPTDVAETATHTAAIQSRETAAPGIPETGRDAVQDTGKPTGDAGSDDAAAVAYDGPRKASGTSGDAVVAPGANQQDDKKVPAIRSRVPAPAAGATSDDGAVPKGRLKFRFFPADSQVLIDGRQIAVQGNLVELDVTAGEHRLTIRSNKGDLVETRSFTIDPGVPLALGTIELGVPPAQ